jgi:acetyl esterase
MPLDPQAQLLLDAARDSGLPPITAVSVAEARARLAKALIYTGEPERVEAVRDFACPGPGGAISIRMYRPDDRRAAAPAVVYFHGGGWVLNSIATHDHVCRALANLSACVIFSVDYRLAPEHPFPAGVDDAWAATKWIRAHSRELNLDPQRIGVAGDSSGANLAAVVAQQARQSGFPLTCQALAYPVTDHWSRGTRSYAEVGSGYALTREAMIWFWNHYLTAGTAIDDPRASPLRATNFAGLPPTLVLTAEYDPLRDEGEAYAQALAAAGVPVTCTRYAGMMHGFLVQFRNLVRGRAGLEQIATFLKEQLAT